LSSVTPQQGVVRESLPEVRPWQAVGSLCLRELRHFFRQRNRVFSAIGQPIMFWVVFGAGFAGSFRLPGAEESGVTYSEYAFPGMLVLVVLFTAIFTTISVIEDRREGFLQSVLVAPIPRWSMVCGKLLGGALIATLQGLLFLPLAWLASYTPSVASLCLAVLLLLILSFALTALGFVFAWRTDSTQGFHAVMSLLLLPLWLLSGAFFPARQGILGWIVRLNPLTYGVAGMRRLLYHGQGSEAVLNTLPPAWLCWSVSLGFAVGTFVWAWRVAGRPSNKGL
jgi:ABC-2 type transport system permease protein